MGLVYSTVGKVGMKLKMAVGFNTAKVKSIKHISVYLITSINPICISICTVNGRYSSYVLF